MVATPTEATSSLRGPFFPTLRMPLSLSRGSAEESGFLTRAQVRSRGDWHGFFAVCRFEPCDDAARHLCPLRVTELLLQKHDRRCGALALSPQLRRRVARQGVRERRHFDVAESSRAQLRGEFVWIVERPLAGAERNFR